MFPSITISCSVGGKECVLKESNSQRRKHLQGVIFISVINVPCLVFSFNFPTIKVQVNSPVTLPCNHTCFGELTWDAGGMGRLRTVVSCHQGKCTEGEDYKNRTKLSVEKFPRGDLSLTISSVKISDQNTYTGTCNYSAVCYLQLHVLAKGSRIAIQTGQSLSINLPSVKPVRVTFSREDSSPDDVLICSVENSVPYCSPEYRKRVSVHKNSLTLSDVALSDSGVFALKDPKTNGLISALYVSVSATVTRETHWKSFVVRIALLLLICSLIFSLARYLEKMSNKQQMENNCAFSAKQ
ncbi:uncharacterized protein LOC114793422 isoform X1 [Denticeps clupeoides]|uniref:uncharacterized protein LOC114793422 isoform X1 n=1 Tax=Denticeps clupeoides TaxID=299321 RepID=UPI0010A497A9|nr:uncharacterized protein LOC114793422 isoform X1 [Denticeps clupeoides]